MIGVKIPTARKRDGEYRRNTRMVVNAWLSTDGECLESDSNNCDTRARDPTPTSDTQDATGATGTQNR